MSAIGLFVLLALIFAILAGLVLWLLLRGAQDQRKSEALESQINELRHDLLTLSSTQAQSAAKMETIANTVATRLEAVTTAVEQGAKNSAEITSQITSQAQAAMSNELKNTREQITQIQQQLGQVQESGHMMHEAATRLENVLGGTKSRGTFGETTLERLLEDCLAPAQFTQQYRFRSGETADVVIHLRDRKLMAIDSKFPLNAFQRLETEGDEARKDFIAAVKLHADSIAKKYIVPDENTLDLALMFVPSESVYYELLRCIDGKGTALDAYCRSKKIMAVSPNTLYAHLTVIAMGLRGMQIEENARRLGANLAGLSRQLDQFRESFDKIGTHLKNAGLSYAEADKRLDKASTSLENLLDNGDTVGFVDERQGTLALPPANNAAAKKSA
ncbi:MAG TPA: DNA recombination protein RmuC [Candidatus Eremiobacteraceae bacterium]|nr:DNA recombination protein RmuC [Candidatus Eremiobacteraceae bacterium]